jgi:hypothetical protein
MVCPQTPGSYGIMMILVIGLKFLLPSIIKIKWKIKNSEFVKFTHIKILNKNNLEKREIKRIIAPFIALKIPRRCVTMFCHDKYMPGNPP